MQTMTPNALKVYEFIRNYQLTHPHQSPSRREIGAHIFKSGSPGSLQIYINELVNLGLLEVIPGISRGLILKARTE